MFIQGWPWIYNLPATSDFFKQGHKITTHSAQETQTNHVKRCADCFQSIERKGKHPAYLIKTRKMYIKREVHDLPSLRWSSRPVRTSLETTNNKPQTKPNQFLPPKQGRWCLRNDTEAVLWPSHECTHKCASPIPPTKECIHVFLKWKQESSSNRALQFHPTKERQLTLSALRKIKTSSPALSQVQHDQNTLTFTFLLSAQRLSGSIFINTFSLRPLLKSLTFCIPSTLPRSVDSTTQFKYHF